MENLEHSEFGRNTLTSFAIGFRIAIENAIDIPFQWDDFILSLDYERSDRWFKNVSKLREEKVVGKKDIVFLTLIPGIPLIATGLLVGIKRHAMFELGKLAEK